MRTAAELAEWYAKHKDEDTFGWMAEVIVTRLPYDLAKPFLKPEAKPEEWTPYALERDSVIGDMKDYMKFAWTKVCDHRGISASRSVVKMRAFLVMLGDDEMANLCLDESQYPYYGAPILKQICLKYGFPIPDDPAVKRMMSGEPCSDDCEGCDD